MTREHSRPGWNWAHLGSLALLAPYAWFAARVGWSPYATLGVHLLLTLLWFAAIERWWPHRAEWAPDSAALRRDGLFFGTNVLADAAGGWLVRSAALLLASRPGAAGLADALPPWAAAPLAVIAAEFGAYWLHRASHAGGWLWRVHAVHHRPEAVNVANNFTTHPINVLLLKLAKLLPLVLLGFSAEAVLWASLFQQLQSFATHANTRGSMGWLNLVIGTAELHRRHHGTVVEEALNFGTAVPLWDQVFGTFRFRRTAEPATVGIAHPEHYPASSDWCGLMRLPL